MRSGQILVGKRNHGEAGPRRPLASLARAAGPQQPLDGIRTLCRTTSSGPHVGCAVPVSCGSCRPVVTAGAHCDPGVTDAVRTQHGPEARCLRRRAGRLLVVVDVGLAAVLLGRVFMRLVAVTDCRVVVLVLVGGGQVGPLLAVVEVVGHVGVLVAVDLGVVVVLFSHGDLLRMPTRFPKPTTKDQVRHGVPFCPVADALEWLGSAARSSGCAPAQVARAVIDGAPLPSDRLAQARAERREAADLEVAVHRRDSELHEGEAQGYERRGQSGRAQTERLQAAAARSRIIDAEAQRRRADREP
jgi:hypothetical protein